MCEYWADRLYNVTSEEVGGICGIMTGTSMPVWLQVILWAGVGLPTHKAHPIPGVGNLGAMASYYRLPKWTGKYGRRRKRIARKMAMLLRACDELEYGCILHPQIENGQEARG